MSYTKHIYNLGNAIEVEEKHTYRLRAPGMKREKKRKLTPAQMKAVNQKNKEKRCRRRLRKYFRENDYFVCLTYKKEERPSSIGTYLLVVVNSFVLPKYSLFGSNNNPSGGITSFFV